MKENSLKVKKTKKRSRSKSSIKSKPTKVLDIQTKKLLEEISTITSQTKASLLRPIVPIEEWVNSEYYIGDLCYTLYPKYKEHLISIFDEDRDEDDYIDEIIILASLGAGKTSCANVILLRKLYELSCYSDIRPLYNLMTSKKLLMVYFSITREVAENTGYAQLRNMLLSIPYFRDNFLPNTKKSYDIDWPERNMAITSGSQPKQVIGTDVILSIVDEGDFYGTTSDTVDGQALSRAQSLYVSIRNRAKSRFMVNGINHSLNVVLSSPTYESGFVSQLIRKNETNPHCYIIKETLWTVKPKGTYSDEHFLVFKGTNILDPQIVEDIRFFNDYLLTKYLPVQKFKSKVPAIAYKELDKSLQEDFVEVPVDFKSEFETNLIQALQDIASVVVAPQGRLFTSDKFYQKAATLDNVFIQDSITISTNVVDTRTIQSFFSEGYKPKHLELPRFLHFDQSITTDEAGVACCYVEVVPKDDGTLDKFVTVEWMMRILPPKKPEQIDLKKLRSICYYLRDNLHLKLGKITFDSYASEEAIQDLEIHNFNVGRLSLDKDDKAYTDLTQLYFSERIKHPNIKRYRDELFNLIWYREKHKVDHPMQFTDGSVGDKGLTDAVCGAVHNALVDADAIYSSMRSKDTESLISFM